MRLIENGNPPLQHLPINGQHQINPLRRTHHHQTVSHLLPLENLSVVHQVLLQQQQAKNHLHHPLNPLAFQERNMLLLCMIILLKQREI